MSRWISEGAGVTSVEATDEIPASIKQVLQFLPRGERGTFVCEKKCPQVLSIVVNSLNCSDQTIYNSG